MPSPNGKTPAEVAAQLDQHDAALTRLARAVERQDERLADMTGQLADVGRQLGRVSDELAGVRAQLAQLVERLR